MCSSETWFLQTTWHYSPEDHTLQLLFKITNLFIYVLIIIYNTNKYELIHNFEAQQQNMCFLLSCMLM